MEEIVHLYADGAELKGREQKIPEKGRQARWSHPKDSFHLYLSGTTLLPGIPKALSCVWNVSELRGGGCIPDMAAPARNDSSKVATAEVGPSLLFQTSRALCNFSITDRVCLC